MAKYLSNIDLNKNQLQNPVIHSLGTAPATPVEGQIYFDSTAGDKHIYLYNGTAWVQLSEGAHTTDSYVSNVSLSGTDLTFTGVGSAFSGTVDLSSLDEIVNNSTVTIAAGDGLSGGGNFTLNQATNASITINVGAGDGIDLNQDDIAVLVDGTTIDFNGNGEVSAVTAAVANSGTALATGDQIYDFVTGQGYIIGNETITLTGDVTGSGTTSIATTISAGAVDFAMINPTDIITEAEGIENNDNDTSIPTSAAVKDYVDDNIVGGLVYQGGYNAATNTPDLDSSPSSNIKKGWTYTVTADGSFFTEQVRVGDVLIAENDAPTTLAEWTTVQNNIDLASLTQIGIGNVIPLTNGGLGVSYNSGTASISIDLANATSTTNPGGDYDDVVVPYLDFDDSSSGRISVGVMNSLVTYAATITDSVSGTTFNHGLGEDVIVQLYDTTTKETVYADVQRNGNYLNITFADTPTNSIRVLVQKIG